MVRLQEIQNALLDLIGWAQEAGPLGININEELTTSESGLYFQQVHPLLTLQNLMCIAPVNSNSHTFSTWLKEKTKASIAKAITTYCTMGSIQNAQKALCENKILFTGTGRLADTVKNKRNLVGFEIVPIRSQGVITKINKVGLQFTKAGVYTLYLMHSSSVNPIKTLELTKLKDNTMEWFDTPELILPYQEKEIDAGGSWYLCYYQSDLPEDSRAIRKDRDWSQKPCKGCSRVDFLSWQAWSKYLEIHPFYVPEERVVKNENEVQLWDIQDNTYTYNNNYGLNLEVSVMCDLTDFIISQRALFQDIIAKQVAVDFLREFAYNANVRTNRHSINASRIDILYELDGDSSSMRKSGLNYQLEQAFKALRLNTEGLDKLCRPCNNNGIKYRTI